jgi:hypothetical protein
MDKDTRDSIQSVLDIQCADGNWNHDPYMHGMANGMIMIAAMVDCVDPDFLQAPETWGRDEPFVDKVSVASE